MDAKSQNSPMENNIRPIPPLHEDIYISLYKYLNLEEQINLSQTCTLLENIFVENVCNKMPKEFHRKSFQEIRKLSDNDMKYFWQHYGSRLEHIIIEGGVADRNFSLETTEYDAMRQYCINLKSLKLKCAPQIQFTKIFNAINLQTITEVRFTCNGIDDDQLEPLTKLQNLEKLGLSFVHITGKHIDRMSKLKHLILRYCKKITMKNLLKICKTLELRRLDIRDIYVDDLSDIVSQCEELQELKYTWNKFRNSLSHFDMIVQPSPTLSVSMCQWTSYLAVKWEKYFNTLPKRYRDELEEITLCYSASEWQAYMEKVRKQSIAAFDLSVYISNPDQIQYFLVNLKCAI